MGAGTHCLADRGNANAALRVAELKKGGMTFNPQAGAAAAAASAALHLHLQQSKKWG